MIPSPQNRIKLKGSPGYGFTITALVAATIMGLVVVGLSRTASIQTSSMAGYYSSSQAFWAAMSGVEFGLNESSEGIYDELGTFDFGNASITVDTSDVDDDGSDLPPYWVRFLSVGSSGNAVRRVRFLAVISLKAVWGDVSVVESTGNVDIEDNIRMNDSIYIGRNVTLDAGNTQGLGLPAYGDSLIIFMDPVRTYTENASYPYAVRRTHKYGALFIPDFDETPYDSLLANAAAAKDRNLSFEDEEVDLTDYDDNTMYAERDIDFTGVTITGGTYEDPGVIVAGRNIVVEELSGWEGKGKDKTKVLIQSEVDDNVIMIAGRNVDIDDETVFGTTHIGVNNQIFGKTDLDVQDNAIFYGQMYAKDDVRLRGKAYGIVYAPDCFTFDRTTSYLEGALFAKYVRGNGNNEFEDGIMNFTYEFEEEYFKTFQLGFSDRTVQEY